MKQLELSMLAGMLAMTIWAAPDAMVAPKNMGGTTESAVADYDGRPLVTWTAAENSLTLQRSDDDGSTWTDLATLEAGVESYFDETAKLSKTYIYRLKDDEGEGNSSAAITVMRYLSVSGYTTFSDGDFSNQTWAWNGAAQNLAFDGGLGASNYLDAGRYPDSTTDNGGPYAPKMGIDFGEATNFVAFCRAVPRYASGQNCEHRLNGLTVYGSGEDWENEGTALSSAISGVTDGSGFAWYSLEVASTVAYRCYYVANFSHGNATEVEFWGWSQDDYLAAHTLELDFTVARSDYENSYAVISCSSALDGVTVQRRQGETGEWSDVGTIASGTFTDETVPYGGTVYYRLANASGESSAQSFLRMRKLTVSSDMVFWQGDQYWGNNGTAAFDGNTSTYPDINCAPTKLGADFGAAKTCVVFCRVISRADGCAYRLDGVSLYGSKQSATAEEASDDLGDQLAGPIYKNVWTDDDSVTHYDWVETAVDNSNFYRSYYFTKTSGEFYGNIAEIEFYGWELTDLAEAPLDFKVIRSSLADYYPQLSWNDISQQGVKVQRSLSEEGPWENLTTVAPGADTVYIDTSARYGLLYYYRLAYDGKTSDTLTFRRLRKFTTADGTFFSNVDSAEHQWRDPYYAFDGSISSSNEFADGARADGGYPKIGLDFGVDEVAVALVRFYPRNEWAPNIRLSAGAIVYGSHLSAADECATTANATALTEATTFQDSVLEWQEREVATPDYYRTYYYNGNYMGNMTEVEFYGWLKSDLKRPFALIIR